MLHYIPRHVSRSTMLIFRGSYCIIKATWPPENEHSTARNMSRIIMYPIHCYRIKELCIKLVIETGLYYDARSEKHQTLNVCFVNAFI